MKESTSFLAVANCHSGPEIAARYLEMLPLPIALTDKTGRLVFGNRALAVMTGNAGGTYHEKSWRSLVETNEDDQNAFDLVVSGQRNLCQLETRLTTANSAHAEVQLEIIALRSGKTNAIDSIMLVLRPVRHALPIGTHQHLLQAALDHHPVGTLITNASQQIIYSNRALSRLSGYRPEELLGQDIGLLHSSPPYQSLIPTSEGSWHSACLTRHQNGSQYWVSETVSALTTPHGENEHYLVSHIPQANEPGLTEQLADQLLRDQLTGLGNRTALEKNLGEILSEPFGRGESHALCIIDLDQFRIINQACGHAGGDKLLIQIAQLIANSAGDENFVARLNGDEFCLLMRDISLPKAIRQLEKLRRIIETFRFEWQQEHFPITISMGVTGIIDNNQSVLQLLSQVDKACYAAKNSGRNCLHVYRADDADCLRQSGEIFWILSINRAIERNHFRLFAQEIAPLADPENTHSHYEILVRYRDETGNLHLPGEFMSIAEENLLTPQIDRWIVCHTLEWLDGLARRAMRQPQCSINLSGHSITQKSFLQFLVEAIGSSGVAPEKLCFELTETATVGNLDAANRFIETLQQLGCSVSLDDFGSGLCSFAYLKNLKSDYLKIDGMFVKNLRFDPIDLTLVRSITDIGHVMGKKVVAEWVEDETTANILRDLEVDYIQGFWIGKPMPVEELELML